MALEIFKLVGSIFVDSDSANDSLSKTDKKAEGVGNRFTSIVGTAGKVAVGVGAMAAAGAAALGGMAISAAQTADTIDEMSQKLGISKTAYQQLDYICNQTGASVDGLKAGMKTLTGAMQDTANGSESAGDKFEALGLSVYDSKGNLKDQESMMWETMEALQKMENQTERAALATDLFGKSGADLMPLFNSGAGSIEEMKKQAEDLGLILSDTAVTSGGELADSIEAMKSGLSAIVTKIGVEFMPVLQTGVNWVLSNMPMIQSVMGTVFDAIGAIVSTVGGIFQNVFGGLISNLSDSGITVQTVFSTIQSVFTMAMTYIKEAWDSIGQPVFSFMQSIFGTLADYFVARLPEISAFFMQMVTDIGVFWEENLRPCLEAIGVFLNEVLVPIFQAVFNNVIAPAVDIAFKAIKDLWEKTLKPVLTGITTFLTGVFTGNWKMAFEGISNIVKGIFDGMIIIVKTPLNIIIGLVNKFIEGLNKLKIPDWIPGIGGNSINIPTIPMLAEGGNIVSRGTVMVGEEGPELLNLPAGARVTPLTGNNMTGSSDNATMVQMLEEMRSLRSELYAIITAAAQNLQIDWNERELARLIEKL